MITILDEHGEIVSNECYRSALTVTPERQSLIKAYVDVREQAILRLDLSNFSNVSRSRHIVLDFLVAFTYTQNLLDVPRLVSAQTKEALGQARCGYPLLYDVAESVFPATYYVEKITRIGVGETSDDEIISIGKVEDYYAKHNLSNLIKLLGRYPGLGIPISLDHSLRSSLEDSLRYDRERLVFSFGVVTNTGLLCSAQRAGLTLPSLNRGPLDNLVAYFKKRDDEVSKSLDALPSVESDPTVVHRVKGLAEYISVTHHLRRLILDEG